jgi:hypothetical protein
VVFALETSDQAVSHCEIHKRKRAGHSPTDQIGVPPPLRVRSGPPTGITLELVPGNLLQNGGSSLPKVIIPHRKGVDLKVSR